MVITGTENWKEREVPLWILHGTHLLPPIHLCRLTHVALYSCVHTPVGMCANTHVQNSTDTNVHLRLGPCVTVKGLAWEYGVVGEMGSFLNRVLPSPCGGHGVGGWDGPQLLPLDFHDCPPPHVVQDVHLDRVDRGAVVPAHDGNAVWPHQEFLKVPPDVMDLHGFPEKVAR